MAALRERYSARDGVGDASRSRLDDAVSLDAQSGSICLSPAGRRRHSHSNTYRDSNGNSHCDGDGDSHSHSDGNSDTAAGPEDYTLAETASNAPAAAIADN
jgi:hypothetical protein